MPKNEEKSRKPVERRGLRKRPGVVADWMQADVNKLQRCIEIASRVGGALRFGYSRDGGAYALGLYGDGEPYTEFLPPDADLDEWLDEVYALYESIHDDQMAARKTPKSQKSPPQGD